MGRTFVVLIAMMIAGCVVMGAGAAAFLLLRPREMPTVDLRAEERAREQAAAAAAQAQAEAERARLEAERQRLEAEAEAARAGAAPGPAPTAPAAPSGTTASDDPLAGLDGL